MFRFADQAGYCAAELVTTRKPDDLPAFCAEIVEQFANAARPVG